MNTYTSIQFNSFAEKEAVREAVNCFVNKQYNLVLEIFFSFLQL